MMQESYVNPENQGSDWGDLNFTDASLEMDFLQDNESQEASEIARKSPEGRADSVSSKNRRLLSHSASSKSSNVTNDDGRFEYANNSRTNAIYAKQNQTERNDDDSAETTFNSASSDALTSFAVTEDDASLISGNAAVNRRNPPHRHADILAKVELIVLACIFVCLGALFTLPFITFRQVSSAIGEGRSYFSVGAALGVRCAAWFGGTCLAVSASRRCLSGRGRALVYALPICGAVAAVASGVTYWLNRLDTLAAAWFVVGACISMFDVGVTEYGVIGTINAFRSDTASRTHVASTCFYIGVLLTPCIPNAVSIQYQYPRGRRDVEEIQNISSIVENYLYDSEGDNETSTGEMVAYEFEFGTGVTDSVVDLLGVISDPYELSSVVLGFLCFLHLFVVRYSPVAKNRDNRGTFTHGTAQLSSFTCVSPRQLITSLLANVVMFSDFALEAVCCCLFHSQFTRSEWSSSLFGIDVYYAWLVFWLLFIIARAVSLFLARPTQRRDARDAGQQVEEEMADNGDGDMSHAERRTRYSDGALLCASVALVTIAVCAEVLELPASALSWLILSVFSIFLGGFLPLFCLSYPQSVFGSNSAQRSNLRNAESDAHFQPIACVCLRTFAAQIGYSAGCILSLLSPDVTDSDDALWRIASGLSLALGGTTLLHRFVVFIVSKQSVQNGARSQFRRVDESAGEALLDDDCDEEV